MQTIINVPGKFKADEYGTPLADVSDIQDNSKNQNLSSTLNNINQELLGKASIDYVQSEIKILTIHFNEDGTYTISAN